MNKLFFEKECNWWIVSTIILFFAFLCLAVVHLTDFPKVDYSIKDVSINVYLDTNCEIKGTELINQDNSFSMCPEGQIGIPIPCKCNEWGCALACYECADTNFSTQDWVVVK